MAPKSPVTELSDAHGPMTNPRVIAATNSVASTTLQTPPATTHQMPPPSTLSPANQTLIQKIPGFLLQGGGATLLGVLASLG